MSDIGHEFETGTRSAEETFPAKASALRKGGYLVIEDSPCEITDISTADGGGTLTVTGRDLFTGTTRTGTHGPGDDVRVPVVGRSDCEVLGIDDGYLNLAHASTGSPEDDVALPDGQLGDNLRKDFETSGDLVVTVLHAMGKSAVASYRPK
ncbi:hypothetical protein ACFC60_26230 [Kitasatospora purpeofusca]|uniref:hypothetical protein n=1 Tax=Kitasatospora purpeofusca TaxID=67352 RepID=UPI0035E0B65E